MGRQEGRREEAYQLVLRQLSRRLGLVSTPDRDQIALLPLEKVEKLADDLLDFKEPADLSRWLASH